MKPTIFFIVFMCSLFSMTSCGKEEFTPAEEPVYHDFDQFSPYVQETMDEAEAFSNAEILDCEAEAFRLTRENARINWLNKDKEALDPLPKEKMTIRYETTVRESDRSLSSKRAIKVNDY